MRGSRRPRSVVVEGAFEAIQKRNLRGKNAFARLFQRKPFGAVGFRYKLLSAAFGRPFDFAQIRRQHPWIEIALSCPGGDDFSIRLSNLAERAETSLNVAAGFFLKLSHGGLQGIFVHIILALGDGPASKIPLRPIWTARMYEKHEQFMVFVLVHEYSGASPHGLKPR